MVDQARQHNTVLVVEDADDLRAVYAPTLTMHGYAVVAVDSGPAALEVLARQKVDAILSDFWMPRMTGVALATAIRANADYRHIPITLISAVPPDSVSGQLFSCILRKPCAFDDLLAAVDRMCCGE